MCIRDSVNYDMDVFAVLLEIDEYQHSRYDKMCEFVRQGKIALSYGGKSVRFIRYNPDLFRVAGVRQRLWEDDRMCLLLGHLQKIFVDNSWIYQDEAKTSLNFMLVDYICYDPIVPGTAGGLVQTFKFATVEEYEAWAEMVAPGVAEDGGGHCFSFFLEYFVKSKQKHSSRHFCCWR